MLKNVESNLSNVKDYFQSLTLLCVDDSKTITKIYKIVFESLFKNVLIAQDGQKGLELFQNEDVDIILTDYDMPVMNGLDMIKIIRKLDKSIPIIFVTAIEENEIIIDALRLNVTNFLKKPIDVETLTEVMLNAVKVIIANRTIEKERIEKLKKLEEKEAYVQYQENLGFLKELNILRNDFYFQKVGLNNACLVDFIYKPLDNLSGDAYSARRICDERYFYMVVDGMGKGVSAAFTTILFTAFVNYEIDLIKEAPKSFSLEKLIEKSLDYIRPILLEDEALSVSFFELNLHEKNIRYALFSMPPVLLEERTGVVHKVCSNNPPMSKYLQTFKVDDYDMKNVVKYLIYSDGMNENSLKDKDGTYYQYIQEDFKNSLTKSDLLEKLNSRIDVQEDDITCIFLTVFNTHNIEKKEKVIASKMSEVESVQEWYDTVLNGWKIDEDVLYKATLTFTELLLNAYEHGNLSVNSSQKHSMIADGTYWDILNEKEEVCDKKIFITLSYVEYTQHQRYIITTIKDEGVGFDTQLLMKIFRNRDQFNGKGVRISSKSSCGIYYNPKGNEVTAIHKL